MRHSFVGWLGFLAVSCLTMLSAGSASAGPYTDDLTKCLVRSTTVADRNSLVKWMFAAAALHPQVKSIASATDADRDALNRSTAKLVERLLTEACRTETQEAVRYEGRNTLHASFQMLGQVAATGLLSDPAVASSMSAFTKYLDKAKLEPVLGTMD